MFAIIGAVIGFLQSLAPEALKFFQDTKDKKHELEIMRLQMEMQQKGIDSHLAEIQVQGQQAESVALQNSYRAELKYSGKYSASVRPTVTYMAMGLYVLQKILLVTAVIFAPSLPWLPRDAQLLQVAAVVWTSFDETLLGWIVGFWFGSRQIKKS
ncbi:MAG: hypothetical protein SFX19_10210 [Alphaproteobacteria bacterium]|nr:hypothetical protein [Alphaproteobacteria bacterium]